LKCKDVNIAAPVVESRETIIKAPITMVWDIVTGLDALKQEAERRFLA
jgi:hypothetical protein